MKERFQPRDIQKDAKNFVIFFLSVENNVGCTCNRQSISSCLNYITDSMTLMVAMENAFLHML